MSMNSVMQQVTLAAETGLQEGQRWITDQLNSNTFNPKTETINFLLNYSKALKVSVYKGLKFESLIN